jgi:UrcA family protein
MFKANPALAVVAAVAVAAALVVPTVSQAAETDSMVVSYSDLNLGSEAGAQVLGRRISYAAQVVCGYQESRQFALVIATKTCRKGAIEGVRPAYEAAVAAARHGTVIVGAAATLTVTAR